MTRSAANRVNKENEEQESRHGEAVCVGSVSREGGISPPFRRWVHLSAANQIANTAMVSTRQKVLTKET